MEKRARIECALSFERPDRPPLTDSFQHAGVIAHYAGISERSDWTTEEVCKAASNALDMVQSWGLGPSFVKGQTSIDRHGIKWRTDTWFSQIIERPFKTADDYAHVIEKEISRMKKASPDYPDTTQQMFLDDNLLMCRVKNFRQVFLRYQKMLGDTVLMYPDVSPGLDSLYYLGGWELFTGLLIEKPGLIAEYMEAQTALQVERAHATADKKLSPAVLIACDIAHKGGLLISPDILNEEYFPRVRRISDAYHEHGIKTFYHSEGNLWQILNELVVGCGIDGLNPLEPNSDRDVEKVRNQYPKLILWGGVDNSWLLVQGTQTQVEKRVEQLMEFGHKGGIMCADRDIKMKKVAGGKQDRTVVNGRMEGVQHSITYRKPPGEWEQGFPLGNGVFGAMFWGDGRPLCFTLDHAELWDLRCGHGFLDNPDYNYANLRRLVGAGRFDEAFEIFETAGRRENAVTPTKTYFGRLELKIGAAEEWESILDIDSAAVTATILTNGKKHRLLAFLHRQKNILCLRVAGCPKEARLKFTPMAQMNETMVKLNYPAPETRQFGNLRITIQQIPEGLVYAVGWNTEGPDFFIAVETAESVETAYDKVKASLEKAVADGLDRLYWQHVSRWRKFWSVSAVRLSEKQAEFFWYYGVYLLASSARRGATPPGLQGLWAMDGVLPPWRGDYHADMNVQETFWPACASGHLDLLDCWCDLLKESIPAAQEFTRRFFQTEGTFWPCTTLPKYTIVPCSSTVLFAWSHTGWLAWLVWLRWRYSFDLKWLAETGYPVVAEMFKFYRDNLVEEPDGYLHVPLSTSPEYKLGNKPEAWCKDPNIDLSLIRRCCDWVTEMEAALQKNDLSPAAKNIRTKLAPYALTPKKELCLWPGKPLDESHRHPSHLMAIHPAMDLTIDGSPEDQEIIKASVEHFIMLGPYLWAGHTYGQMVSFAAVLGRAGWAYDNLRKFIDYWVGANGLHFNVGLRDSGLFHFRQKHPGKFGPFTMESNCGISAGISDMLVQGWGDKIRVFPAVPEHWRDAAFRGLLVEGAFRVSAVRQRGLTVWVKITAGVKRQMRLLDPFADRKVKCSGARVRREGDLLVADLKAGQSVIFSLDGKPINLTRAMAEIREEHFSPLGL